MRIYTELLKVNTGFGWETFQEAISRKGFLSNKDRSYELKYIEETGQTGTEDFNKIRYNKLKKYRVELRKYRKGNGDKRVASEIIGGEYYWVEKKRFLQKMMEDKYKKEIQEGYELKIEK